MEVADAVTKDGWILGRKMLTLHDSGAYARFSPYGLTKHSFHHRGLHDPEPRLRWIRGVHEPRPHHRDAGLRVTSVSFATETHMSRIADSSGSIRTRCA